MSSTSSSPVAVVTGGARGIGLAIGQWFLAHGHKVVLLDVDKATLDATEKNLNRADDVLCLHTDVSQPEQVQAAADQVLARFGRVDALVNNAGVAVFKPALETTFEDWRHVLSTNLDGAFLCTQAFGKIMTGQRSGAIVNIASISGLRASARSAPYGAVKAAVMHYTASQAKMLARQGIRVNCVAPGSIEFPGGVWDQRKQAGDALYDRTLKSIPFGRMGTPDDVARAALFFLSPDNGFVTGQVLYVCGGTTLGVAPV